MKTIRRKYAFYKVPVFLKKTFVESALFLQVPNFLKKRMQKCA